MSTSNCTGEHRFYVAEVCGVESEGKLFVIIVCTSCGEFRTHELAVSTKGSLMRLLKQEEKENSKGK
jgi:hypothetical protein